MAPKPPKLLSDHWELFALVAAAIALHLPIFGDGLNFDAATALDVAHSLATRGTFELDTSLVPNHPPGLAAVYLPVCAAFGYTEATVHGIQLCFLAADLFFLAYLARGVGRRFAIVPPLLLALDPVLYLNMSEGRALTILIFFTLLILWGIWKGLEDSRWLLVAAAGAAGGFLTADAVGYLFLVAGGIGFAWRFYYVRWALFRDKGYLAAMGLFGGVVVAWTAYEYTTTGAPYTDPRTIGYLNHFLFDTAAPTMIIIFTGFAAYFLLYALQTALPFLALKEGRRALGGLPARSFRDQRIGALVLFVAVVVAVSSLLSSTFVLYEPMRSLNMADTYLRYAAVVAPITYLAVGMHLKSMAEAGRAFRWVAPLAVSVLLLSVQLAPKVSQGDANGTFFADLERELSARGYTTAYSEGAIALRYNLPSITFISIDKGYHTPYVNITTDDVPLGAAMVTSYYVPKAFDKQIGSLYLIDHFDPNVHSPFRNLYYVE